MTFSSPDSRASDHSDELIRLLSENRDRLKRMVALRIDRRCAGRIDASDVVQDAFAEAALRFKEYEANPEVPPYIWLRFLTGQKLSQLHRRHLGIQARDAGREVALCRGPLPGATTHALAAQLVGKHTSPSHAFERAELKLKVQQALNAISETDREVLTLRHFEQLSNQEAAMLLGIAEGTCYKRYVRALQKLGGILGAIQ